MKYLALLSFASLAFAQMQDGTVIDGQRITSTTGACISVGAAKNVTIRNSEIGPCRGNAIQANGAAALRIYDNYIHPESTILTGYDVGDGVYAVSVAGLDIIGNVIAYGQANIEVQRSSDVTVKGNFLVNPKGHDSRGQQFQCYDACTNVLVDGNYTLASRDARFNSTRLWQEDAINIIGGPTGNTVGVVVSNNYVNGGFSPSGCGAIIDAQVSNAKILNNWMVDMGQCGVGVAAGTNIVVDGNKVLNRLAVTGGGNQGMYVWNQYPGACGPVTFTNNVSYQRNVAGQFNSWWNGGGCSPVTFSGNTLDAAAQALLSPPETKIPAPLIPPGPFKSVVASPWTNNPGTSTVPPVVPPPPPPPLPVPTPATCWTRTTTVGTTISEVDPKGLCR